MKGLLIHLDELNSHINNLNDVIDNFMNPEEKPALIIITQSPTTYYFSVDS